MAAQERHPVRLALRALGVAAVLWGCSEKQPPHPHDLPDLPSRGGTFRMAQDPPKDLDPARMDDSYEATIINQVFDGLLAFDSNLNTIPSVAKSWQISPDGRLYTFRLKEGVLFHDGSEVTSDDVLFSFSRVFRLDPEESVLSQAYLSHIEGSAAFAEGRRDSISGLRALSKYEIEIELEHPYASFLSVLASELSRLVPRHYVEEVGIEEFGRRPVGCGPFRFADWTPGRSIVLTAFPEYHLGPAYLDSIVYEVPAEQVIPSGSVREYAADQFLAGELTAVEITPDKLEIFQTVPDIQLYSRQELSLTYIALNIQMPPFDDPRVRRAFALAIDHERISEVSSGQRSPSGILPPGLPGYTPDSKLVNYDPDAARRLLAEAGYPGGKGLPPVVHVSSRRSSGERRLQEELAAQLAEVGFDFRTVHMEWLDFAREEIYSEFEAFSITWVADIPDPDSFLTPLFHSEGSVNYYGYANPQVDELLEQGSTSRSNGGRWDLYRQAERIILEDLPVVPIHHPLTTLALRSNVRGFWLSPLGGANLPLGVVWFEDESQGHQVAEAR